MKKTRIWELDFVRGFAIVMMIFDHLMYDLKSLNVIFSNFEEINNPVFNWLFTVAGTYFYSELRVIGHFFFISLFLIVSGISYTFSSSNIKRGLKLGLIALLINVVTYLIDVFTGFHVFVVFGIIHMISFSILLIYLCRKIWNNETFIFIIGAIFVVIGFVLEFWNYHYITDIHLQDIPALIIGLKAYGSDSFGIVPYVGIMMIGTVIGTSFYYNGISFIPITKKKWKVMNWFGRNSLIIFLTHQFVLYGIVLLIGYIVGYRI